MKQKTMKCGCVVEQYGNDDPELVHCAFHRRDPGQDIPPEWLDDDGKLIVTQFDDPTFWLPAWPVQEEDDRFWPV